MGILILVKEQLLTGHDSHYAGGIHLFGCLASALSQQADCVVHIFSTASEAVIMHHAVTHSLFTQLHTHYTTCGAEVISWEQPNGLHHHCVVHSTPPDATAAAPGSTRNSAKASALLSAVAETCSSLAAKGQAGQVLLDVDTLQHAAVSITLLHKLSAATSGKLTAALQPTSNTAKMCVHHQQQHHQQHHQHNTLQQQQQQEDQVQDSVPFMLALAQQCCSSCPAAQNPAGHTASTQHDHPQHQQQAQQQQGDQEQEQLAQVNCGTPGEPAAWQLLAFVQNLHHLPFGPCGTGPRSPAVLQAWQSVSGVLCVSQFIRSYLEQHALPHLPQMQPRDLHVVHPAAFGVCGQGPFEDLGSTAAARLWGTTATTPGSAPAAASAAAPLPKGAPGPACAPVGVTSNACSEVAAALTAATQPSGRAASAGSDLVCVRRGVCRSRPAETAGLQRAVESTSGTAATGAAAAAAAAGAGEWLQQAGQAQQWQHALQEGHEKQEQQPHEQQWQQVPVVGMLKLTREKGSELFLALAAVLPQLRFKAVCAEPQLLQQVTQAGCSNVQLVQPVADVSAILQGIDILVVPSILHEAFGMVVLDAMLHGIPVLVAAAGALQEAAAGTAAGLAVPLMHFPPSQQPQTVAAGAAAAGDSSMNGTCAEGVSRAAGCEDGLSEASDSACMCCWLEGQRSWANRVYPPLQQEHVVSWAGAIQQMLSSRERYLQASSCSRAAAQQVVRQGPEQLAALVQWLRQCQVTT